MHSEIGFVDSFVSFVGGKGGEGVDLAFALVFGTSGCSPSSGRTFITHYVHKYSGKRYF